VPLGGDPAPPDPDPNGNYNPIVIPNLNDNNNVHNVYLNKKLLNASFSIQNVRSMNVSTKNDMTAQKILAICNLKSDIIFLSDLRLNSQKQISAVH